MTKPRVEPRNPRYGKKGTNTSTGAENEGLEWDDDFFTETDWKEVKAKSKRRRRKEKKDKEIEGSSEMAKPPKEKEKKKKKEITEKMTRNLEKPQIPIRRDKSNTGRKPPVAKPEALLVEVKDRDYASVLKEVKSGLASAQVVFSKVRKTRKGDILLELEKGQEEGVSQIKEKVRGNCPSLTLRALKESAEVIIRGLDLTVEKEEVEEVLKQKVKDFRIKSFWENSYGNKTAVVELPKNEAQKLVDEKKIKIGWMRVPVGLMVKKKRCYRCLEYGHISTGCPGQDRSKKCYNCGDEGHKARDCVKEASCAICKDKGQDSTKHRMGSKTCPSWNVKAPGRRIVDSKNAV
ncbi:uncharacterized protein PF3D7_1120000-like [Maniola hyperantus]|uniref:uncharacterized protein PF3D7_1120000-like n=1 Tax=Aphantopus hyperantus TaxID=2795564 RepID=UPI00374A5113